MPIIFLLAGITGWFIELNKDEIEILLPNKYWGVVLSASIFILLYLVFIRDNRYQELVTKHQSKLQDYKWIKTYTFIPFSAGLLAMLSIVLYAVFTW